MRRLGRWLLIPLAIVILAGLGGFAALRSPSVLAWLVRAQAQERLSHPIDAASLFDGKALRLILCGTASPLPDPHRAEACALVIAGDRAFVIDTGPGSWKELALMGFPAQRIAAVLLTHFHSDHIGDLGEFRLQTWVGGRKELLPVYGGPGVERVVAGFNEAYAQDDVFRSVHHGHDVAPLEDSPLVAKPFHIGNSDAHDAAEVIVDDGEIRITAFEVNHMPAKPAVGYRFDYKGRSIVISGDTRKWPNVALHAKDADVLVHEAQSQRLRAILADAARGAGNKIAAKILDDIESYHTDPVEAADIANQAKVKLLVFTHFTPPLVSSALNPVFFEGVDAIRPKGWVAGFDGFRVDLPIGSDELVQSAMPMGIFR